MDFLILFSNFDWQCSMFFATALATTLIKRMVFGGRLAGVQIYNSTDSVQKSKIIFISFIPPHRFATIQISINCHQMFLQHFQDSNVLLELIVYCA